MKEIHNLTKLKKEYEKFRRKYKLPEFSLLNQEFEVEKIQEKETDFLLREIRRAINDKIAAFLRFFELFLNPQNAPVFILSILRTLTHRDKEIIEKIYHELVNSELSSISLDIVYDERKEADFIKRISKRWQDLKPDLKDFIHIIEKIKTKEKAKKKRSYFG